MEPENEGNLGYAEAEEGSPNGDMGGEGGDRRSRRPKKAPVPELPAGSWVRVGDSCRSSTLRGQAGTVIAWGRQVEVAMRGADGSEQTIRKINPTDLVALSEEPELDQVTGGGPAPLGRQSSGSGRGVRSTLLGKSTDGKVLGTTANSVPLTTTKPAEGATGGVVRGGRPPRTRGPKKEKEEKKETPQLPVGGWVQVADSCRSATLRGQYGVVQAVGRQVEVQMGEGEDAEMRKFNPNDLIPTVRRRAACVRRLGGKDALVRAVAPCLLGGAAPSHASP